MSSIPFDDMTEDEQDQVARTRIKEILSKPKLEEGDAETVAACVAFIGTSQKMADKFSQALLDTAESLVQGLCVRCGETPGEGTSCTICESIKKVRGLKVTREKPIKEYVAAESIEQGDLVVVVQEEKSVKVARARTPWTAIELTALDMNSHLSPKALAKYIPALKGRSEEEVAAKKKDLDLPPFF